MNCQTISQNGHSKSVSIAQDTTQLEILETPITKKVRKPYNNKTVVFDLTIDAGAKNTKVVLNGEFKSFPSVFKIISDEVPLRDNGCFLLGKKNYVVGSAINRVNGEQYKASDNSKLDRLDIWVLGAICHFREQLKKAVATRRRKTEPTQLALNLRILTLSSLKRKELEKAMKSLSTFIWDDETINISVKKVEFLNEASGALSYVAKSEKLNEFKLLDLGGGTLTYSSCEVMGDESTSSQQPISGGGMVGIIDSIFTAMSRTDRGCLGIDSEDIQLALELSKVSETGDYYIPLQFGEQVINIESEVRGALSDWLNKNRTVFSLFNKIPQDLRRGFPVRLTGGGFAVPVIADWVATRLSKSVENADIKVLVNPEKINITGL